MHVCDSENSPHVHLLDHVWLAYRILLQCRADNKKKTIEHIISSIRDAIGPLFLLLQNNQNLLIYWCSSQRLHRVAKELFNHNTLFCINSSSFSSSHSVYSFRKQPFLYRNRSALLASLAESYIFAEINFTIQRFSNKLF